MKALLIAAALSALAVPSVATAQEMKAERAQGTKWVMVEMVKFLPGKRDRAAEIAEGPFTQASNDIGGGVIDLHFNTGEWDFITVFPMAGGPGDLSWQTSPVDVQFMNALAKRVGGMDAAMNLFKEWDTLVASRERHVAHRHDNLK